MSNRRASSRVSAVQEIGGAPEELQTDRIRAAELKIASGDRVLLAVVADGSGAGAGDAAARVVEQVFQVVQASRPRELAAALRRGMEIADQGLLKAGKGTDAGVAVAATAVAIWKSRVHFAHVGHTLALHVSNGRAQPLIQSNSELLGTLDPPQIHTGSSQLRRGDRVVLASDGLMRRNPETGGPFVGQDEIAEHATELSPNEAGRHLVSLALGRDVDDNVSVAVLALPGRAPAERGFPWAAAVVGLLLIGLAAAGSAFLLNQPNAPPTTDYGYAVLVEGGALADQGSGTPELVANLGTVPSGSFLTASTDAKLGMQSTFAGGSAVSQGALYLEQSTGLELSAIDPRAASDNPAPQGTDLNLVTGRLLILRESGTWEFRVHGQGFTASLIGAGRGAIGIAASADSISLFCLLGTCGFAADGGERVLLQVGEIVSSEVEAAMRARGISHDVLASWNSLCDGCVGTNP